MTAGGEQVLTAGSEVHLALWGKAQPAEPTSVPSHPLLFHMLDVALVAQRFLDEVLPRGTATRLLDALAVSREDARAWLCFFVALHDLGKATPAFQQKWAAATGVLERIGFDLAPPRDAADHGTIGVPLVAGALGAMGFARSVARPIARAVAAHHGSFATDVQTISSRFSSAEMGRAPLWVEARASIVDTLKSVLGVRDLPVPVMKRERDWGFFASLAGLTSVADWVGSMQGVFRYERHSMSLSEYLGVCGDRAVEALATVGFRSPKPQASRTFAELFDFEPRPLQRATADVVEASRGPFCAVIEAPMGEGKTEAALYVAAQLGARSQNDGTYFALPTQATANQIFDRLSRFLEATRPEERINLQLVHGEAVFSDRVRKLLSAVYQDDRAGGGLACEPWFLAKKRALLAPFGAGTIDQALLGVMLTKHAFVRLFGLAGKTVIFDEVHAYDTYTSTVLDRLVAWLGSIGATVVILSATLPSQRRKALLDAYAGHAVDSRAIETQYPRISWASGEAAGAHRIQLDRCPTPVRLLWDEDDEDRCIETVSQQLLSGGCIGVLRNTVRRSQETFRRLVRMRGALPPGTELLLLHARFPNGDRAVLEQELIKKLGPKGARPARMVVVGTQVLEQSLDVDFDLLITDLAPIDLLLQRAGRLHRHAGRVRPPGVVEPIVRVAIPPGDPATCDLRRVGAVYEPFVLRRSLTLLRHRDFVSLPDEIEPLVEAVYGAPGPLAGKLAQEHEAFEKERNAHETLAKTRVWRSPASRDDPFAAMHSWLDEEDNELKKALRAETRLGDDSIEVVCLFGDENEAFLDRARSKRIDLRAPFEGSEGRDRVRQLASRTVRVSRPGLVQTLRFREPPPAWKDVSVLARRRPLFFDEPVRIDRHVLELDPMLGLLIEAV